MIVSQTHLLWTVGAMPEGSALLITRQSVTNCARGLLESQFLEQDARPEDINKFLHSITDNWRVDVIYRPDSDLWELRKL